MAYNETIVARCFELCKHMTTLNCSAMALVGVLHYYRISDWPTLLPYVIGSFALSLVCAFVLLLFFVNPDAFDGGHPESWAPVFNGVCVVLVIGGFLVGILLLGLSVGLSNHSAPPSVSAH